MTPVLYRVPRAVITPISLAVVAAWVALGSSHWFLVALPFIYLGSICAAPKFNLIDAAPAFVAVVVGIVVQQVHQEAGTAILAGTSTSWLLSAIEKRMRMVPIDQPSSRD